MATDFDTYTDGTPTTQGAGGNAAGAPAMTVVEGIFDAYRRNLDALDTVEVLPIPAGTFVYKVLYEVLNGEASQTLNVGDADDKDGFVAAADVATTGASGVGGGAYAAGRYYADGGVLLVECPTTKAYAALKVRVVAQVGTIGLPHPAA